MPNIQLAVVEDSASDRRIIATLARGALPDAELALFHDAGEFRKALEARNFDCVLLDYMLPDSTGLHVLESLREDPAYRLLPVVILTGHGSEDTAVKLLKAGATDYLPKDQMDRGALRIAVNSAIDRCAKQRMIEQQQQELRSQALTDSLTRLHNRGAFQDRLDSLVAGAQRHGREFGLMFIDLNKFKLCNDTHGHAAGDAVLVEIADRLRETFRASDAVFRLGGDEFAVLMDGGSSDEKVETLAKRVVERLGAPVSHNGRECYEGGGSVGIATFPRNATNATALVSAADHAMYQAKRAGGGYAFATVQAEQA